MKPLHEQFLSACELDAKAVHDFSIDDDLSRFSGKFPNATIELIAGIVASSKAEGAAFENARLLPLLKAAAEVVRAAERFSNGTSEDHELTNALAALAQAVAREANAIAEGKGDE